MKRINSYLSALKHRLWIRGMADAETLTEIEGHLLDAMDKGIREGLSAEEAEQRAIERFGSVQTIIGSFEKERMNIMKTFAYLPVNRFSPFYDRFKLIILLFFIIFHECRIPKPGLDSYPFFQGTEVRQFESHFNNFFSFGKEIEHLNYSGESVTASE